MEKRGFGTTHSGKAATLYTMRNNAGFELSVTDFGATLVSLRVPKDGALVDVVLGYDDVSGYEDADGYTIGATVGRSANRIGGAAFALGGKMYHLTKNDGDNNLHSGLDFYHKRLWQVAEAEERAVTFALHSPDGDQGYPAALDIRVTYTLLTDGVAIDYAATPDGDTIVNLTNHSYFNLNGHDSGDILGHLLQMNAATFTPADAASIPTGEIRPVDGTPMDFRTAKPLGRDIDADYEPLVLGNGYDHNWCLDGDGFRQFATLTGDKTGLTMAMYTDLPGVQVYSGNFLMEEPGKNGAVYRRRQGVCFEIQHYPDAIHHANFPSPICPANQTHHSRTEYRFV